MNSRKRVALTMLHKEPDRVPVMCQLSLGHYLLNTEFLPHELWYSSEAFAGALITLQRRYRFDGILVNLPGRTTDFQQGIFRLEKTSDGEWLTWKNGDRTFLPWDDSAHHFPADKSKPDRANFATLDPDCLDTIDDYLGYLWNIYHIHELPDKKDCGLLIDIPDYFLNSLRLVKAKAGSEISIHAEVFSPFTHFMELFGYQQALMGLVTDSAKSHAVLDRFSQVVKLWAQALTKEGVDAILISSAFTGAPFLSRKMYKEFVVPYEYQVTTAVIETGTPVYTHTCGSIGKRLDIMLDTGTQGIDTLDPPPLGDGDLAHAKRDFGDKLFFKGNMNSVALLDYKTEAEVIADATNLIKIGMPGAGYILSTACSVAPRVEPWKIELLTPLAEKIGRY